MGGPGARVETRPLQPIRKIVREAYAVTERVFRHFPDRLLGPLLHGE